MNGMNNPDTPSLIYIICPVNDCEDCTAEFANDALGFDVYAQGSDPLEPGDNEWTEGVKIMEPDTYCLWFATIPTPNDLTEIDLTEINWVGGACFEVKECKEPKEEPETKVLERNHEMECFKVWVNEDNNFEFVFWWEYKDNNHVQIFDMAGNLVWEIDFEKGEPRFVAELPDGMYTVKTFHEAGHILQEFVIGKP